MSQKPTLVVVGFLATTHDDEIVDIPDDLEELSAYELSIRLGIGRSIPERVLIFVDTQEEVLELINGIEGMEVALDLMTDDPKQPKPETLEDLMTLLPKSGSGGGEPTGSGEPLFNILE